MPHQCVKCEKWYDDEAAEIMQGCSCGANAFLYKKELPQPEQPVLLEVESINEEKEGKYELDLHALFGKSNLVIRHEEGKYTVDLQESFRRQALK